MSTLHLSSGIVVAVEGGELKTLPEANMHDPAAQWKIDQLGSGFCTIQNVGSGDYLSIAMNSSVGLTVHKADANLYLGPFGEHREGGNFVTLSHPENGCSGRINGEIIFRLSGALPQCLAPTGTEVAEVTVAPTPESTVTSTNSDSSVAPLAEPNPTTEAGVTLDRPLVTFCPSGHSLRLGDRPALVACDTCDQTIRPGDPVFHCHDVCDYDACTRCGAAPSAEPSAVDDFNPGVTECPAGHALNKGTRSESVRCNCCERVIEPGAAVCFCEEQCDYDVCVYCHEYLTPPAGTVITADADCESDVSVLDNDVAETQEAEASAAEPEAHVECAGSVLQADVDVAEETAADEASGAASEETRAVVDDVASSVVQEAPAPCEAPRSVLEAAPVSEITSMADSSVSSADSEEPAFTSAAETMVDVKRCAALIARDIQSKLKGQLEQSLKAFSPPPPAPAAETPRAPSVPSGENLTLTINGVTVSFPPSKEVTFSPQEDGSILLHIKDKVQ